MQRKPFATQGVEERRVDECRSGDVLRVEGCNACPPKMLVNLVDRCRGRKEIWACRATRGAAPVSPGFGEPRVFDTRKYHIFQSLLPVGRKLDRLEIKPPVMTELEKGVRVAHAKEPGVL